MINKKIIQILSLIAIILFLSTFFESSYVYARKNKAEAQEILDLVELKVMKLQSADKEGHSKDLIIEIKTHISDAQEYMSKRKYDLAYYMAKLAEEYIELFHARVKLDEAIQEYNAASKKQKK